MKLLGVASLAAIIIGTLLACLSCKTHAPVGIPNLHAVDSANNIWRGGQPLDAASWQYLKSHGITNVLKLNTDAEGSDAGAVTAGMTFYRYPITTEQQLGLVAMPKVESVLVIIQPNTFIHCEHGQDRTGLICAMYRVRVMGWTKADAEKEMLAVGFHKELHGLHEYWERFEP